MIEVYRLWKPPYATSAENLRLSRSMEKGKYRKTIEKDLPKSLERMLIIVGFLLARQHAFYEYVRVKTIQLSAHQPLCQGVPKVRGLGSGVATCPQPVVGQTYVC